MIFIRKANLVPWYLLFLLILRHWEARKTTASHNKKTTEKNSPKKKWKKKKKKNNNNYNMWQTNKQQAGESIIVKLDHLKMSIPIEIRGGSRKFKNG